MVVLVKHNRDPHQTAILTMGRPVVTHNNIAKSETFLARIKEGSNIAANRKNLQKNMAAYIRGLFMLKRVYSQNSKNFVRNMAEHIISKREQNQRRFISNHMRLMTKHQRLRNNLNKQYANAQNKIASSEPNFKNLLNRIREKPDNENLKRQRNNRLNRNSVIQRIKLERNWLYRKLKYNSNLTTQHMRQIQAWNWVRVHVVPHI
jgi:hypothetical protein